MISEKQIDIQKVKQATDKTTTENNFVIYDPENPPFERLHLCQYLSELPDLEAKDNGKSN